MENESDLDREKFNNPKIKCHVIGKRLTFKTAFEFCKSQLPTTICVVANSDIYFD